MDGERKPASTRRGSNRRAPAEPRSVKPSSEQPGNSFRYLYWRLSEKEFQQLCAALLRDKYDDVQCFPVGMKDGGIDAISHGSIVYQVKWSSKLERNPETWLAATIKKERANIERLVREKGITRYILMTSVAGTTTNKGTGSIQKLKPELDKYAKQFGIPVECWWQAEIDAEVDGAPDAIKWSFSEMLAGSDAIRFLIDGSQVEGRAYGMRETVLQVIGTQAREDSRVKFSQGDLDQVGITDLFIDVHASITDKPGAVSTPSYLGRAPAEPDNSAKRSHSVGAVAYLLHSPAPLIYLLGAPGQGKSTLGQYLCQIHRAAILQTDVLGDRPAPRETVADPKLPLRVDLKDYAAWLAGYDPFGEEEPRNPRPRRRAERSVEMFLAQFCTASSGGRTVAVEDVQSLLERYPTLLVLDGLDEVADPGWRTVIVEQIRDTAARMAARSTRGRRFQILVTSRPNASGLAEPDRATFETMRLEPLTPELQHQYVTKWCEVNGIAGKERRDLRRTFFNRIALDHVAQLADNPMQLTILLFLISRKGEAVPVSRTPLYTDYMSALMDREVSRRQIEREQVPRVQEVTSFLGWHMHSGVEADPSYSRMVKSDIETALLIYFSKTEGPVEEITQLFRAASDRFWALTSKIEGTFEFSVQPVREYFTARYLAHWAGRERREPLTKKEILQHLIGRPYWLNTARFYAGFATPNELAGLRYGLEDAFDAAHHPLQERVAAWALVADGIFANDARVQRDVVGLLADDLTVALATHHPDAAVNFPRLAAASGGRQLAEALLQRLDSQPDSPLARAQIGIVRERTSYTREEFLTWWTPRLRAAIGRADQTAWLKIGAHYGGLRIETEASEALVLTTPADCSAALAVGAASAGSTDQALLRAVLDGWCSDTEASPTSEAGLLLRAMRPQWFHQLDDARRSGPPLATGHLWLAERDRSSRTNSWSRLIEIDSRYEALRNAANTQKTGRKGTTELWQNPARELTRIHGPSWLAAEIAVAGAANQNVTTSGSIDSDGQPLGPNIDYGSFVVTVRGRPDQHRWRELHDEYEDSLSRRTWALALLATAQPDVIASLLPQVDTCLASLTSDEFAAFAASSSRLGASRPHGRLFAGLWSCAADTHLRTRLVLAHFAAGQLDYDPLPALANEELVDLASPGAASWPIARAITARLGTERTPDLFAALTKLGSTSILDFPAPSAIEGEAVPADYQATILIKAASYPGAWVVEAERRRSFYGRDAPLDKLAAAEDWLPFVPRLQPQRSQS
jgi:hypothetical protein